MTSQFIILGHWGQITEDHHELQKASTNNIDFINLEIFRKSTIYDLNDTYIDIVSALTPDLGRGGAAEGG